MWFWVLMVVLALLAIALLEQYSFMRKSQGLPGPSFVPPFLGNSIPFLMRPWIWYRNQDIYGDMSWNSIFGIFMLFTNTNDVTRSVFLNNNLRLWLAPGAKEILGFDKNIAFMHGPEHKEIRRRLLPLFSRKALSIYIPIQEECIRKHMDSWLQKGNEEFSIWPYVRDLNIETSLNVFIGNYVTDENRPEISSLYMNVTAGFRTVPFNIPFSTFNKAIKSREVLVEKLSHIVKISREYMSQPGSQPRCLLDFFVEEDAKQEKPTPDLDVGFHILDFVFASQDASTASLVWVFHLLDEHPDVLERIRAEQKALRPNDEPLDFDVIQEMKYTRQVVKEVLRYRPPAVFVPHEAIEDTKLTDTFTAKKGTIILPSIWHSCMEGYSNPSSFDPDRFSPERREDVSCAKNFMVFGTGSHACMGKEYAMNHLTAFIALAVVNVDWLRIKAQGHDGVDFRPTIVPADGCVVKLSNRKQKLQVQ